MTMQSLNLAYGVNLNSELKFLHLAHRYDETKWPDKISNKSTLLSIKFSKSFK